MAARKNKPVLYEKVCSARSRRDPLPWRSSATEVALLERPEPRMSSRKPIVEAPAPPAFWRIVSKLNHANGRVQVVLGWPGIAGLSIVFLFVLFVSYKMGAYAEHRGQATPSHVLPQNPDTAGVEIPRVPGPSLNDLRIPRSNENVAVPPKPAANTPRTEEPVSPSAGLERPAQPLPPKQDAAEQPFEFRHGYSYVTVQYFKPSQAQTAEACRRMLAEHGIPTVIVRSQRDIQVIATEPFLLKQKDAAAAKSEKQRCEDLKLRIKKFGKEAFADQYKFALDQAIEREH